MEPLRTQGLDHVALTVSDLRRAHDFYAGVLGLESRYGPDHEPMFVRAGETGLPLFSAANYGGGGDGQAGPIRFMHVAFRVDREQFFPDPDGHQVELATYEV